MKIKITDTKLTVGEETEFLEDVKIEIKGGRQMSELKEFTAEQMRGCPPFELGEDRREEFLGVDVDGDILIADPWGCVLSERTLFCNPIDRMNAIAKHLFELMPNMNVIILNHNGIAWIHENFGTSYHENTKLGVNPFIHTDRTEITREELGL